MSRSDSPDPGGWRLPCGLALAVLCVQLLAALNPDLTPLDHEELYNAAHARLLQLEHLDAFQQLQYRSYCGGCTINALLGAGLFAALGPSLLVWKLVPVLFNVTAVLLGAHALQRTSGRVAAVVFAGLFLLPPPTWQRLSLVAWGNHMEAGCVAVVAVVFLVRLLQAPSLGRALGLGLVVGFGMWIGFSSGFVALAVAATLLATRQLKHLGLVVLGALPVVGVWALQAETTGMSILDPIYYPGERLPDPTRIPGKLWSLLAPRQLVALFGFSGSVLGWIAGWAWAAVAAWALLRSPRGGSVTRTAGGFVLAFVGVYSLVRFTVWTPPSPEVAPPGSMRYAAPLFPLLFLVIGGVAGEACRAGRQRWVAAALVPLALVGLGSRAVAFTSPFPSTAAFTTQAADMRYLRDQASYRLSSSTHSTCSTQDAGAQAVHAYGVGWHDAQAAFTEAEEGPLPVLHPPEGLPSGPYFEAVGAVVWTRLDPHDQGDFSILGPALSLLSAQSTEGQRAALSELAWRRSQPWMEQLRGSNPHGRELLADINEVSQDLEAPGDDALRYALGRRWAFDLARWATPRVLEIPGSPVPGPGFLEGLAHGLGTQWGPEAPLKDWWPPATPPSRSARRAYEAGIQERWISPDIP